MPLSSCIPRERLADGVSMRMCVVWQRSALLGRTAFAYLCRQKAWQIQSCLKTTLHKDVEELMTILIGEEDVFSRVAATCDVV